MHDDSVSSIVNARTKDIKYMSQELMKSKKKIEKKEIRGKSLFLFKPGCFLSRWLFNLVTFKYFDTFILSVIILSTVFLAIETPFDDPDGAKV